MMNGTICDLLGIPFTGRPREDEQAITQAIVALKAPRQESPLLTAAEHVLAEFGVTEPGAGADNHESPAGEVLDALYTAWLAELRVIHGNPDLIAEPNGRPE